MALSDLADLAAVLVGVLALGASLRIASITARLQSTQIEQSRYDELTEVLLDINKVLPRMHADPSVYQQEGQALRFLASRAHQLIGEVKEDRITPFDLLSIGNAFFQVSGMERATDYLEQAQRESTEPHDRIPVLAVLATIAFTTGSPKRGREAFAEAVDVAARWRHTQGDTALDTALLQTLMWAAQEHAVPDPSRRDSLLDQAEGYLPEFVGDWRRVRGRGQIDQYRAAFAQPAAPVPSQPGVDLAPEPTAREIDQVSGTPQ